MATCRAPSMVDARHFDKVSGTFQSSHIQCQKSAQFHAIVVMRPLTSQETDRGRARLRYWCDTTGKSELLRQGNRILNASDRQGLVDRSSGTGETGRTVGTNRTNRTNRNSKTRSSKTCNADWIHLTKNPIGPIGPVFHPLIVRRIQNAIALTLMTIAQAGPSLLLSLRRLIQ